MKLKALSLNKGIIKANLKRFWWIIALMSVYMFLILPYGVLNNYPSHRPLPFDYAMEPSAAIYGIILPIILGCFLLSYLHKVNSVTAYHSLPITRESLLISAFVSGIIITAIPMVINAVLLFALLPHTNELYSAVDILKICGHYFLYSVLQLIICFLVGMFTGNIFAQGAFAVILNLLPMAFYLFISVIFNMFLRGYPGENNVVWDYLEKLPVINAFNLSGMTTPLFLIYFVAFIIFFALTIFFYKKRPLETAGDIITFKFFKPIFKYGLTTFVTVCGYLVFMGEKKEIGGIFIALIFAVIGYSAAEMLLTKSFRFWKGYKGFIIYIAIFTLSVSAIAYDIFGYSTYVPQINEIETAYVNFNSNSYKDFKIVCGIEENIHQINTGGVAYKDAEGIADITKLHTLTDKKYSIYDQTCISIGYVLKNGKTVYRSFEADSKDIHNMISKITKTEDYVLAKHPFLAVSPDKIAYAEAFLHESGEPVNIKDNTTMSELLNALKDDLISLGEVYDYEDYVGQLEIFPSSTKQSYYVSINSSMTKTIEYIKSIQKPAE